MTQGTQTQRGGMGLGVGGAREAQKGGDICILRLIHVDVWQKPTQYCNYPSIKNKLRKNEQSKNI